MDEPCDTSSRLKLAGKGQYLFADRATVPLVDTGDDRVLHENACDCRERRKGERDWESGGELQLRLT